MNVKVRFLLSTAVLLMVIAFVFFKNKNNEIAISSKLDEASSSILEKGLSHPSQGPTTSAESSRLERITEGDAPSVDQAAIASLAEGLVGYDVLRRNEELNRLKDLAQVESNLDPIFAGIDRLASDHPSFSSLVAALAAVGTPAIQARLRQLLVQRDDDWRAYAAVVPAFSFLQQPTNETLEFLAGKSRHPDPDFSSTAALALGAIVRTLHVQGRARGAELLENQIQKLKSPNSRSDDIREALAVLGNAGLPETEEIVMSFLGSDDLSVRSDAALALRFVSSYRSEQALLERLAIEEDLETRMTLIDALVHRPVSTSVLAAVRSLLSVVPPAPAELREKALDLFFHSEMSHSDKKMNSDWLKQRIALEPASPVKKKMNDIVQMLSQNSQP